ncbi:MAG: hypothetical protein QXU32_02480 [Nitrososphaerales archaeon]
MSDLQKLAIEYKQLDEQYKKVTDDRSALRDKLLELMTKAVKEEVPLPDRVVYVQESVIEQYGGFETWCLKRYPGHEIKTSEYIEERKEFMVCLAQKPEFIRYEFIVDATDGLYKFGRTIATSTPTFDADKFYKENENLRHLVNIKYEANMDAITKHLVDHPEDIHLIQSYMSIPKLTQRLLPFTKTEDV